ncbi:hypothetical protein F5Y18DRAFT_406439 [Xylariaceae sp. FL1019]|nr:hypothetical protein F5Y18DRAFT_406439 [Xylariaceae sp. FL1019]
MASTDDPDRPSLANDSDYHPFIQSQGLSRPPLRNSTRYLNPRPSFLERGVRLVSRLLLNDGVHKHSTSPAHALQRDENGVLSFRASLKFMISSSYINYLIVFVPFGIVTYWLDSPHSVIFAFNAISIVPLSNILGHATECIAADLGDAVGALMNISFGNLVEIIMFFAALRHGHLKVVKSALVGSILVNLLLILGTSIIAAEFQPADLVYDMNNAQALACLLSLTIFSILIPMAFHFTFKDVQEREYAVRTLSRASSVILLIVYFVYLAFLLVPRRRRTAMVTSEELFDASNEERGGERGMTEPYVGSELNFPRVSGHQQRSESVPRTIKFAAPSPIFEENAEELFRGHHRRSSSQRVDDDNVHRWMKGTRDASKSRGAHTRQRRSMSQSSLGTTRSLRGAEIVERYADGGGQTQTYTSQQQRHAPNTRPEFSFSIVEPDNGTVVKDEPPKVSHAAAILVLTASTFLTAICAEFLVDTIGDIIKYSGLTQSFIGLVILSVVGNAAEYMTGVRVAARGKLDLAIGVSFGSSIQIALFVSPLTVIGGWAMGKNMDLYMGLFETSALIGSAILVNFVMVNGRTNYLEGTLLCACYVIIGIGSYLIP